MYGVPRTLSFLGVLVLVCESTFIPTIRLSPIPPSSENQKTLLCEVEVAGRPGSRVPVLYAQFYLNGSDVIDQLTGGEYELSDGSITFELSQGLEGCYTCRNDTYSSSEDHALMLVFKPTADTSIDLYYAAPVGGFVELKCGVKQGALASLYKPKWIYDEFREIDTQQAGSRFKLNRKFLEDFSLTITYLYVNDSDKYYCGVEIDDYFVEGPMITLLVYQEPSIVYMTDDQILSVNSTSEEVLQFVCNATGTPHLELTWAHNGMTIEENDNRHLVKNEVSTNSMLTVIYSVLTISDPTLTDTGTISCEASISFQKDNSTTTNTGAVRTISEKLERELIVLDTSLEPRPILTQASDLLVKIDLPIIEFSKDIRVRVRLLPENELDDPVEFDIDGVFSGVSTFYPFIPASQVPATFRRFWIQIALIVNNVKGPFNPPEVTSIQFIDYDEDNESCDFSTKHLLIGLGIVVVALVALIICICIVVLRIAKQFRRGKEKVKLRAFESSDKTMERYTKLLESLYAKVEKASNIEMEKIFEQIERYSSVLEDLARLPIGVFADDGSSQNSGTTPDGSGGITVDNGGEVEQESAAQRTAKQKIEALKVRVKEVSSTSV